jgi:hypothetical protein
VTGEPDDATLGKLGVAAPGDTGPADPQAPAQAMGAQGMMGMMTPEMMQMMQRMMAQRGMGQGMMGGMGGQGMPEAGQGGSGMMGGTGARGMPEGQTGPGMMGGMAGQGMPGGGMRQRMMGHGPMAMGGGMMGCPMMHMRGAMGPPGVLYGTPHDAAREMTPARVRAFLEQRLEWHGNPRLKIGEISSAEDGNITAEIVTVDGSLVQKFAFNRYPGLFRHITE